MRDGCDGQETTIYGYDGMDRLTSITYNDGTPNASFTFNNIGQLSQSSNSNVTNNYLTFDQDGRVQSSNVQVGGATYPFSYTYDLAGDLLAETYPSGRKLSMSYDNIQRPLTASGTAGSTTTPYVQQAGYFPHGAPQYMQYGSGLWSWQSFNSVLQPTQAWATQNNNGNNWMFYAGNGFDANATVIAQQMGYSSKGTGVPWNSMTFNNDQFAYDFDNRLFSVTDTVYGGSPTNYTRTYGYDEYGNRSITNYTSSFMPSSLAPINTGTNPYKPANNHLVGATYEARGSVATLGPAPGSVRATYEGENRLSTVYDAGTNLTTTWIYDAEGQRAEKWISNVINTIYVHDAFGQLAAEYDGGSGLTPACVTCYLTYDMLGTPRMITNESQLVVARHDFAPFGEEIPNGTANRNGSFASNSNVTQAFIGQESDLGLGALDYFNARTFSANGGGFLQADPGNAGANVAHPQSWNAYSYVLGNPLGLVDPSGMSSYWNAPQGANCTFSADSSGPVCNSQVSQSFLANLPSATPNNDYAVGLQAYLNNVRYGGYGGGFAAGWGWVAGDNPLAILGFVRLESSTDSVPGAAVAAANMLSISSSCAALFNGLPFNQSAAALLADQSIQFGTGADPRGYLAITRPLAGSIGANITFMSQGAPTFGNDGTYVSSPGPFSASNISALNGGRTIIHELIHAGIIVGMQPPSQGPFLKWTQLDNGLNTLEGVNNSIVDSSCPGGGQ